MKAKQFQAIDKKGFIYTVAVTHSTICIEDELNRLVFLYNINDINIKIFNKLYSILLEDKFTILTMHKKIINVDTAKLSYIQDLKKGDFCRTLTNKSTTFRNFGYCRNNKKYELENYDNTKTAAYKYLPKNMLVLVNFTY